MTRAKSPVEIEFHLPDEETQGQTSVTVVRSGDDIEVTCGCGMGPGCTHKTQALARQVSKLVRKADEAHAFAREF